jgi:hypothetical protein
MLQIHPGSHLDGLTRCTAACLEGLNCPFFLYHELCCFFTWWIFFYHLSDLMQWCVWGLQLELTFLLYLLYAFLVTVLMVCFFMILNFVLTWHFYWSFCFILFGHRWNTGNASLAWYLFLLYAMHPLGQNGCIIRFLPWTLLCSACSQVILFSLLSLMWS